MGNTITEKIGDFRGKGGGFSQRAKKLKEI